MIPIRIIGQNRNKFRSSGIPCEEYGKLLRSQRLDSAASYIGTKEYAEVIHSSFEFPFCMGARLLPKSKATREGRRVVTQARTGGKFFQ